MSKAAPQRRHPCEGSLLERAHAEDESIVAAPITIAAGMLVALVLATDGLMHAYWATGGIWPASNRLSLVQVVLNSNKVESFRPAILAPLAAMLLLGALTVLAQVHALGRIDQLVPDQLLRGATIAVAAALLLRGLVGTVWIFSLFGSSSTPFYRVNLILYTPACLVLFAAATAAASR